jgi:hypothetical protein
VDLAECDRHCDSVHAAVRSVQPSRQLQRRRDAEDTESAVSGTSNTELKDAFKAEPSCASFGGAGGRPPVVIVWG